MTAISDSRVLKTNRARSLDAYFGEECRIREEVLRARNSTREGKAGNLKERISPEQTVINDSELVKKRGNFKTPDAFNAFRRSFDQNGGLRRERA